MNLSNAIIRITDGALMFESADVIDYQRRDAYFLW